MNIIVIEFSSRFKVNNLIMMSVNIHNSINLTNNGGSDIPSIMRDWLSGESVSSGDFFLFSFKSQNNRGVDNSFMVNNGINVSFRGSHFRGDISSSFRGNVFKSSIKVSSTRLSFIMPSINTISRTNGIFFISGHTSLSNFTPSAVNIGGTEITRRDSQTHFIIGEILDVTRSLVSNRSMDNFSSNMVFNMSSMFNSNIF